MNRFFLLSSLLVVSMFAGSLQAGCPCCTPKKAKPKKIVQQVEDTSSVDESLIQDA